MENRYSDYDTLISINGNMLFLILTYSKDFVYKLKCFNFFTFCFNMESERAVSVDIRNMLDVL